MAQQPSLYGRRLVSGEVVEHNVNGQADLDTLINLVKECREVFGAVLLLASREDLACRDFQHREEIEGPVTDVVVGLSLRLEAIF